jgi:NADH pyrophosphatase NudC (nudix superfamily)
MSGLISLMANFLTKRTRPLPRSFSAFRDRSAELRAFEAAQQHKVIAHPSVTLARLRAAVEENANGAEDVRFCTVCGTQHTADATTPWHLHCRSCGAYAVYGADELLFSLGSDLKSVDGAG